MDERTRGESLASADPGDLTPVDAVALALDRLVELRDVTDLTFATLEGLWRGVATRAQRLARESLADVDAELVVDFVRARNRDGSLPSVATMHSRRWSVRFLFQTLRELGLPVGDPTLGVSLPARTVGAVRPLTDDEVALCRVLAVYPAEATLKPAAWGLAEATATTAEIPAVRRADVETERGIVRLPGSRLVLPRRADLTDWAREQLDRRLREIEAGGLVAYEGNGPRPQAASAMVIGKVLRRAGLAGEPGIRPASIRAWVGLRVFEATGSIEEVARRLGVRSLDAAARLIGLDWRGN